MIPTIKGLTTSVFTCVRGVFLFYYEGFKGMTIGRTLWIIILLKLFIFFVVIKFLFFPNLLSKNFDNDDDRADYVRHELLRERR